MYIMKEFISKDFPGDVASPMAALLFLRPMAAARCFSLVETSDPALAEAFLVCLFSFSMAEILFIPSGWGDCWAAEYPGSDSLMVRSTDHFL